jgi:hypothetical protein
MNYKNCPSSDKYNKEIKELTDGQFLIHFE